MPESDLRCRRNSCGTVSSSRREGFTSGASFQPLIAPRPNVFPLLVDQEYQVRQARESIAS